ncbi:MAG: DNA polymerase III subunit chi [Planctomycetota bacterium]
MSEEDDKVAKFIELQSPDDRTGLACQWIERNYERGNTVAVHAADRGQASDMDKKLWTFKQNSFIPHGIVGEVGEPVIEPVLIAAGDDETPDSDVLMVLSDQGRQQWLEAFDHVYDFAPLYDDDLKQNARRRFKAYQEAGFRMRYIN